MWYCYGLIKFSVIKENILKKLMKISATHREREKRSEVNILDVEKEREKRGEKMKRSVLMKGERRKKGRKKSRMGKKGGGKRVSFQNKVKRQIFWV